MIQLAKEKGYTADNADYHIADCREELICLKGKKYDVAFTDYVYCHMSTKEDLTKIFK